MTDEEYRRAKEDVVKRHGMPEWEGHEPANESARAMMRLRIQKANETKAEKKVEPKPVSKPVDVKEAWEKTVHQLAASIPDPDLKESDLVVFDETEKTIIRAYFRNLLRHHEELAEELGVTRQKVTAVLNSDSFKLLYNKVFNSLLPLDALIAIRANLKKNDSKTALEVARHYGFIKAESVDLNVNQSKPIEDTDLAKLLKRLGDGHKAS